MKTKQQIHLYNKEYFARPKVIARAKVRNAQRRHVRKAYKKTEAGKQAGERYRRTEKYKRVSKNSRLKSLYGITLQEYEEILKIQESACAICRRVKDEMLHVDHCHLTNRVRGLLCGSCNRALGLLKDNTEFLYRAIEYLSKS